MMSDLLPSDISLFEGLSAQAIAAVALIYFVAFSIRGVIGFGSGMPAVLFSSWILDPHHAVLLALTTGAAAQVQLMPTGIRHGDWQVALPLMIAVAIAIVFGIWIFGALPGAWLTLILGLVMCAIVLMDLGRLLSRFAERIDVRAPGIAAGLAGTSGLIAAVTGSGGMYFLAVYLKLACPTPEKLRATNILMGLVFMFWRFAVAAIAGLISFSLLVESLLLLPVVYLGVTVGTRFFGALSDARFYRIFQVILLLMAMGLVWKGSVAVL